jgi:DNA-binding HxlR family transcriptional regulator
VSSKENVAVFQLLALLESRYAMRVLWALKDGHAQTFRLLQDSVGGITPNTLNTRIKELREAGLLTHGPDGYVVTPSGVDLLKRINDLQAFATRWVAGQAKKVKPAAVPAAPTPAHNGASAASPASSPYPAPASPAASATGNDTGRPA